MFYSDKEKKKRGGTESLCIRMRDGEGVLKFSIVWPGQASLGK